MWRIRGLRVRDVAVGSFGVTDVVAQISWRFELSFGSFYSRSERPENAARQIHASTSRRQTIQLNANNELNRKLGTYLGRYYV